MKQIVTFLITLAALAPAIGNGQEKVRMDYFGDAYQLVYFGVLEGLFRDGVKTEEVDLILRQENGTGHYDHFIYACPICMATIHALELYRDRPPFYGIKDHAPPAKFRTFGEGLPDNIRTKLSSDDVKVRLTTIHELVGDWVSKRLESLALTAEQRQALKKELEAGRNRGMEMLQGYQRQGPETVASRAPAYAELKECAICNAALKMEFKTE